MARKETENALTKKVEKLEATVVDLKEKLAEAEKELKEAKEKLETKQKENLVEMILKSGKTVEEIQEFLKPVK